MKEEEEERKGVGTKQVKEEKRRKEVCLGKHDPPRCPKGHIAYEGSFLIVGEGGEKGKKKEGEERRW